jgi:hypothetical protein
VAIEKERAQYFRIAFADSANNVAKGILEKCIREELGYADERNQTMFCGKIWKLWRYP